MSHVLEYSLRNHPLHAENIPHFLSDTHSLQISLFRCEIQFQANILHYLYKILTPVSLVIISGISLGMRPANERRCYNVTTSLIAWAHI